MKTKIFSLLLLVFLPICIVTAASKVSKKSGPNYQIQNGRIELPVPIRPKGQTDVLELTTAPIPRLRVAFIGLGMRGPGAVERFTKIEGVEIVALCDVRPERVAFSNKILEKAGLPKALEFSGDTNVWRKVTALPNVDLIYVATDWAHHAIIGVQAMKDGKHVAIEVPSAMSMKECWDLVNTSEKTRKHCMQLENCVYDYFELTTLNMVQQGVLGEILHGEGAYIHNLEPFWHEYWNNWRLDWNVKHSGDVYPTHGLGPVCQAMNIHRGDKMNYLVSMATKAVCIPEFIEKTTGKKLDNMKNGDLVSTMIRTEKGKSILIEHDVATPRPYSRMYQLTGTKGFANKYPVEGYALVGSQVSEDLVKNHEDLSGHSFLADSVKKALMKKYEHPIQKEIGEYAKTVGGHGGMDFIMDYRLVYCLRNGLPLDMDVYDLAEWCCLTELTGISIENNSMPVAIPDFTRGAWDKLDGLKFAFKK